MSAMQHFHNPKISEDTAISNISNWTYNCQNIGNPFGAPNSYFSLIST